jgi:hypothetical protein
MRATVTAAPHVGLLLRPDGLQQPSCTRSVLLQNPPAGRPPRPHRQRTARDAASGRTIGRRPEAKEVTARAPLALRLAAKVSRRNSRVAPRFPPVGSRAQCGTIFGPWLEAPSPLTVPSIIGISTAQAKRAIADAYRCLYFASVTQLPDAYARRQSDWATEPVGPATKVGA